MIKESNYMNGRENLLWASIFLLLLMSISDSGYSEFCALWTLQILIMGNVRRIRSQKYRASSLLIRRSFYILPMLVPLAIGKYPETYFEYWTIWSGVGIIIGLAFILPKLKEWKVILSADFIALSPVKERIDLWSTIILLIAAPVAEEYFFRFVMITVGELYVINLFLGAFLFFLSHYGTQWSNRFSSYDFIIQILFGLTSGELFILSHSLLPSILAHLVYNSPRIILNLRYIHIFSVNVDRKELL
ncbi:CPBP family intramembrane metalloprotease [Paenibacillus sp. 19GGS1-52]|uniref:CPBP family glutamic-type intramembrane protease n=1 Tax=Paenibacillus sp. 19GGS1-52 TaxID=2758563 RepID=UPI001EFBA8BE|nr:CPBP family glutamic-type intramembrane protease [Paenibacillus sp. 19GGS1-52]ULO05924.1 CPBP family intramembrane metalloprotease [Paenibacillus sp. 19GGS1-52]